MASKALEVLQLKPGTRTEDEIKKQYRILARKYHPDRVKDENLRREYEEKFKKISDAYQFLTNSKKDNNLFKIPDIYTILTITLNEYYQGVTRIVSVPCQVICNKCQDNQSTVCDTCHGQRFLVNIFGVQQVCNSCLGHGIQVINICDYCHNKKVYNTTKELEVNIDADSESEIVLYGQGHEMAQTNIAGDIRILLDIEEHPNFILKTSKDLLTHTTIDLKTALLGGTVIIKHLDDQNHSINIPECSYPDQEIKINGLGLVTNQSDLYVKLIIEFPKSLSLDSKKLLSQINF